MLSTIILMLTIAVSVLAGLIVIGSILKGMFRPVFRSGVSLIVSIICIPLAVILASIAGQSLSGVVVGLAGTVAAAPIFADIPSAEELSYGLVQALVAPLLFALIYFVLRMIIGLIAGAISRAVEKGTLAYKSKPIGALVGLVCGLVLCIVYFTPLAGYTGLVSGVMEQGLLDPADESALFGDVLEETEYAQAKTFLDTPVLSVTRTLGGGLLFDSLGTVSFASEHMVLTKEIRSFAELANAVSPLIKEAPAQWGEEEIAAIETAIPAALEHSALLRILGAETLSGASNAWLIGNTFAGIAKPKTGGMLDSAIDSLLEGFTDTTSATIVSDIRGITPLLSVALKAGTMNENASVKDLLYSLAESADTPESKSILVKTGITMIGSELGLYPDKEAVYTDYTKMLAEMSGRTLTDDEMLTQLALLNDNYVIEMSDAEEAALCKAMKNKPFRNEAADRFAIRFLSTVDFSGYDQEAIEAWISEVGTDAAKEEQALAWLTEAEIEIPTSLVTVDTLKELAGEETFIESFNMDEMLAIVDNVISMAEAGATITPDYLIELFGDKVKTFAKTEAGAALVLNLVKGILQRNNVCTMIGITPTQATIIINALEERNIMRALASEADMVAEVDAFIKDLEESGSFANMGLNNAAIPEITAFIKGVLGAK